MAMARFRHLLGFYTPFGETCPDARCSCHRTAAPLDQVAIDRTVPAGKWEFDADVADVFDDMLRRSIPQYEVMRDSVFRVGAAFIKPASVVADLGCSRGESLAPFVRAFGALCRFVAVDASEPMVQAAKERFKGYPENVVDVRLLDLRKDFPPIDGASVVLSVLTLQFVPIEYRTAILGKACRALVPGGAMIVVEKLASPTPSVDVLLREIYLQLKRDNAYSEEQIERKRLSLEGVLVPLTAEENEGRLRAAGFREVECFWRWMNFGAFVAVK